MTPWGPPLFWKDGGVGGPGRKSIRAADRRWERPGAAMSGLRSVFKGTKLKARTGFEFAGKAWTGTWKASFCPEPSRRRAPQGEGKEREGEAGVSVVVGL